MAPAMPHDGVACKNLLNAASQGVRLGRTRGRRCALVAQGRATYLRWTDSRRIGPERKQAAGNNNDKKQRINL
jgi:hypothetical protein